MSTQARKNSNSAIQVKFTPRRGGKRYTVSTGAKTKEAANRFKLNVDTLVEAFRDGKRPPQSLDKWIGALSDTAASKLTEAGLIDEISREAAKDLFEHIEDWAQIVLARKNNTEQHARRYRNYIRHLAENLNWTTINHIDDEKAAKYLRNKGLSPTSQRQYLIALENFCQWLYDRGRVRVKIIRQTISKPKPTLLTKRRPYTPDEATQLLEYLKTLDRYPDQNIRERWNGYDRYMIYKTMMYTALRKTELSEVRVYHLQLSLRQPIIHVDEVITKNDKEADIPIPEELAAELREYIKGKHPNTKVFWIIKGKNKTKMVKKGKKKVQQYVGPGGAKGMLHRDLEAAGLGYILETARKIDYHCFRHTAITWWLEGNTPSGRRLTPEHVRRLARLSSLAMVQNYVRGNDYDTDWLKPAGDGDGEMLKISGA